MHLRGWLAIGLVFVAAGLALAKDRTWTSSDGRTMQGEFVRELDGDVTFLIGGKLVTIAIDKLAERDQQIVRDLAAGKTVPEEAAPAKPVESRPAAAKPAEPDPFAPVPDRPEEPTAPSLNKKKQKGPESRVWTDIFGRKGTGKFIRIFGSSVVVSRAGGPLTIDFFELSEADQAYVRELLTSRGEEDMIPIKPPPMPTENDAQGAGQDPIAGRNPGPAADPGSEVGAGPGPAIGPGPSIGPRGPGMGPRGPGIGGRPLPPRFGPPIGNPGASPDTASSSPPYDPGPRFPPASPTGPTSTPYTPPASDFTSSTQRILDSQAEQMRRDADRLRQGLDQSAQATANLYQRVPVCSSCRKQVTEVEAKGSSCPHCGARWAFNHYDTSSTKLPTGNSPLASLSGSGTQRAVRSTVLIVGAVVVVVVLCGGAIAIAMAIASASRPKQSYRI